MGHTSFLIVQHLENSRSQRVISLLEELGVLYAFKILDLAFEMQNNTDGFQGLQTDGTTTGAC
ncbi:hypothetical protein FRC18_007551 [Serendipita sp. 400]|nr:hypothetical protein FRC18_007551 [Serendipita sp. 400]